MKKLIFGIFISLGAIFLMSHNAMALDLSIDLNNYENLNVAIDPDYYDYVVTNAAGTVVRSCNKTFTCDIYGDEQLRVAKTHKTYDLAEGDIITYNINVWTPDLGSVKYINWRQQNPGYGASNFYFHLASEFKAVGNNAFQYSPNQNPVNGTIGEEYYRYSATYEVANIVTVDGWRSLGSFNQNTIDMELFGFPSNLSPFYVRVGITGFNVYRKKKTTEQNKEQEQATQNAADESKTTGNNSQNSSQGATSNLLSVFTGFANVITNASATSCIINAPLNTTFSSDTLNVDLCGLDLPPAIGALTSIIAVMVVVPFAISMFNKFIGIMQGFQR